MPNTFICYRCGKPVEAEERPDDEHAGTSDDMGREYEPTTCHHCGQTYQSGEVAAHVE